jgi:hypothetical protein
VVTYLEIDLTIDPVNGADAPQIIRSQDPPIDRQLTSSPPHQIHQIDRLATYALAPKTFSSS